MSEDQDSRSAAYYRDILMRIGRMFGEKARTASDGTLSEEPIVSRVSMCVSELISKAADAYASLDAAGDTINDLVERVAELEQEAYR